MRFDKIEDVLASSDLIALVAPLVKKEAVRLEVDLRAMLSWAKNGPRSSDYSPKLSCRRARFLIPDKHR